eukprot:6368505-Amphidinium_carterae.1
MGCRLEQHLPGWAVAEDRMRCVTVSTSTVPNRFGNKAAQRRVDGTQMLLALCVARFTMLRAARDDSWAALWGHIVCLGLWILALRGVLVLRATYESSSVLRVQDQNTSELYKKILGGDHTCDDSEGAN